MIHLYWFLFAWLLFMAVFSVMAGITVVTNLRFGLSAAGSYLVTAVFLGVTALVLMASGSYFMTVNWSQTINAVPAIGSPSLPTSF